MINSYEIDKKLEPVLRSIEKNGVKIDVDLLHKLSQQLDNNIKILTKEINKDLGHEINLNSPKQLAELLYKKLNIKARESGIKYKKMHFSTSAQALGKIRHKHPAIDKILQYRELSKLKNTYVDPLPKLVDANDRLHTHYAIDTATGRFSSKDPNLQNIPSYAKAPEGRPSLTKTPEGRPSLTKTPEGRPSLTKTPEGKPTLTKAPKGKPAYAKLIRSAFIAEKGCKLIKADYSQIELRVMAHLAHDEVMMKIFKDGKDIHTQTGEEMGCDRRTAKVVNFGVLYGMSAYGLADTLKIPIEEAQFFIDKYFMTFSGVKKYIDEHIRQAQEKGYVETMFGRKREIPELKSSNKYLRSFGTRAAVNTPVQGTAAEIIKLAMLALNNELQITNNKQISNIKLQNSNKLETNNCKLILQVHDELVFEVPEKEIKKAIMIIKDKMENAVKLDVPLLVEIYLGDNWQEMEKVKI